MEISKVVTEDAGEEVVRAAGELAATTKELVKQSGDDSLDSEEVQGWIATIIKAVVSALK